MENVIDIVHRLSYEADTDVIQAVNKEFGTQLKQLQELKQKEAEYNALLDKTGKQDINRRKVIQGLLNTTKQQYDAIAISIGRQTASNDKLNASLVRTGRNLSSLSFAGSQLLREAPAFTYSIQTGILALSNNIPILLDQLTQARNAGATTTEIFKSLGNSIFGLTGLITIAVSALTIFGGKLFSSGEKAKESAASIDTTTKALDNYAKMLADVANFNDEGSSAIKRNIEALKAQGVTAGETYAAEKKIFEQEQALRKQEAKELNDRVKIYQQVALNVSRAGRGSAEQRARRFQQSVSGLPAADRDALVSAFEGGTLTTRSINERILALREEIKNKSNQITAAEVQFNSELREKEYNLQVELLKRISENETDYQKLRLNRGATTFEKIQQLNKLELQADEEKLNAEIQAARKAGILSTQIQSQFETLRLQIRKQANEKLLQESLEYLKDEEEILGEVVRGLGKIFEDKNEAPKPIPVDLNETSDEIKRRLSNSEKREKEQKEKIKDNLNYAYNTTVQTLQSIYEAQLYYLDKELEIRRDRVAQATELAEKGNTEILEAEKNRLQETEAERERVAQRQLQLDALLRASSAAIAATQAIQTITNAGATGDPYTIPLRIAAAVAALAAGFAFVQSLTTAFKFKDGVIGLQGEGTETSDSIPARLSKGESVMTAAETREFRPYLEAMRDGTFYNMVTAERAIAPSTNYGRLEKKLDGVIAAVEGNKINVSQRMDKNGLSQAVETYTRRERNRFR